MDQQLQIDLDAYDSMIRCRDRRAEIERAERRHAAHAKARAEARAKAKVADIAMQRWCAMAEKGYGVRMLVAYGCPESTARLLVLGG